MVTTTPPAQPVALTPPQPVVSTEPLTYRYQPLRPSRLSPIMAYYSPPYNPLGSNTNSPSPSYAPMNVRSVVNTPPSLTCTE